jgi:hypothetical protein
VTKLEIVNRIQLRLNEVNAYTLKVVTNQAAWRDNEDAQRASRDVSDLISKLNDED